VYGKNPLYLKNFGVERISVTLNGRVFPTEDDSLRFDFAKKQYMLSYLMAHMQLYGSQLENLEGLELDPSDWANETFFWPITLPNVSHIKENVFIRLHVDYTAAHTTPIIIMMLGEYDRTINFTMKAGRVELN
jgi:hypothetical protein